MKEWTYDNPKKRSAAWEYLYWVIEDRTGEYPDGLVLMGDHLVKETHECHDRILDRHKFFKDFAVNNPNEREKLLKDGYRVIFKEDLIEVGSIRFENDGTRYFQSRTGWEWDKTEVKRTHRKTKKLILSVLKKRQKAKLEWVASKLDSKKAPQETTYIAFAPQDKPVQEPEIFLVPKGQTIIDFIQEKQLEPWRVLSVGSLKPATEKPMQVEVTASHAFAPYEHTKEANEHLAVQKMQNTLKPRTYPRVFYTANR